MARPFYGALWLLFALVLFIADEHGVLGTYGSGATFSSAGTGGTDGGQVTEHDAGVELLFFGLFLYVLSLRNTTLYLFIMLLIVFGVVASYCTEIFDGCIFNTDGVYHVLGEVARDGAMIVGATVGVGKVLPKRFLIIILLIVFDVVSSHCTGIFDGCIFNTDGAYPVLGEQCLRLNVKTLLLQLY